MAVDRLRRDKRREHALIAGTPAGEPSVVTDPGQTIDVERAIRALSSAERAVLVLKHFEGYDHAEIAALLDITSGASRVRYLRALRRLRQLLELDQ
jgi:RNA polymerase sigma-70 factor (ECF subfamily)